jgi:peroxiredoxin
VQIVPVLAQQPNAVKRYIEDTGLPFNILVDVTREVAKAYGVWHRIGVDAWNIARPAAFLIDRGGIVRYAFVGSRQDKFPTHGEIMAAVAQL